MIVWGTGSAAALIAHHTIPEPGQLVEARRRQWIVSGVDDGSVAPGLPNRHLIRSASIDEDALGEEIEVLWELEPGAHVIERASLQRITGLDDPDTLQTFLDAVQWGVATNADRTYLQAPFSNAARAEVLRRFAELNRQRYEEEQAATPATKPRASKVCAKAVPASQGALALVAAPARASKTKAVAPTKKARTRRTRK